jgi:AraC family transcriptional regulator
MSSSQAARLVPHRVWLDGLEGSATQAGARGFRFEAFEQLTQPVALDVYVVVLYVEGRTAIRRVMGRSEERFEVGPGAISLLPPAVAARWSLSDPIEVLNITIEPSYLRTVAREVTGADPLALRMRHGLRLTDDTLVEMGVDIVRELRPPRSLGAELSARAVGERIVIHLLRNYFDLAPAAQVARGAFSRSQVAELRDSIATNLGDQLHLERLAKVVGLGVHHFCRVFRDTFGQTPHDYVRERRLERARHLLLATSESVGMIAFETGFADQSHLTRCFKRHFGMPPAELRKKSASFPHWDDIGP